MAQHRAKKAAAMKKISTITLFQKAKRDPAFLNALLRDPEQALAKKRFALSSKDLRWLKQTLKKVYKIDGKNLVRLLMEGNKGKSLTIPWPWKLRRPWPGLNLWGFRV